MKTKILLAVTAFLCVAQLYAQQDAADTSRHDPWENTRLGNERFKQKDFTGAVRHYKNAVAKDSLKSLAKYNLGDAYYRLGKFDSAAGAYRDAADGLYNDSLANAWHNMGNALLKQKKYNESIDAYKNALRMRPGDEDARYNLAYALSKMKSQPPSGGNGGSNQQKNGNQQKNANGNNQNNNSQKNMANSQSNSSQQKNQGNNGNNQKPQPQQMSKDEAQRMLSALRAQEQKTRQKMSTQSMSGGNSPYTRKSDKDW